MGNHITNSIYSPDVIPDEMKNFVLSLKIWSSWPGWHDMMTSSNGNIFCVTGHLCGEFTGPRWIPHTKASDAELWCFTLICARMNGWVNNREAGDLRRYRTHYDVIVMTPQILKMIGNSINHPLVYMINMSLQQGIFPKEHNIANVLPLFKANIQ